MCKQMLREPRGTRGKEAMEAIQTIWKMEGGYGMQWNQLSKILVFVIFGIHDSCVYRYKRQGVHGDRGDYGDHSEEVKAVEAMGKVRAMGEMQATRFLLGMGA